MEYRLELRHAGIKGMKWGIRRYQNKDGSLTPAGKQRYGRDADEGGYDREGYGGRRYKTGKGGKIEALNANPDKWVSQDMERTRKLTDESSTLANKIKNANDNAIKRQPKTKMDLSNMSDKEMRDQINRALLERQYNDLFAPQNTSRGREYTSQVLDTVGTVLGITGSALGVALSIRALMGKG